MVYSVYSFVHRQIDKPQRDYFDKGFCRWARTFSKNLKTQMNDLKQSRFLQKWCYNSLLKMKNTVQHQETISYITGGQHKIMEIQRNELPVRSCLLHLLQLSCLRLCLIFAFRITFSRSGRGTYHLSDMRSFSRDRKKGGNYRKQVLVPSMTMTR